MEFPRFKKKNNLITNNSKKKFRFNNQLIVFKKNNFKECFFLKETTIFIDRSASANIDYVYGIRIC